ncbi:hypothetical protein GPJ56_000221 [Histomonas meleagridis]|uniref:uncharacterized protein n=1 Tax=Histomonas meleagridis TaxID=135588 RepID=UPI00355A84CE|nr:hypothetical protein GPJ56_000221 [Histomonas meleagridis]KAH0799708.1 hypothetical protein GO595_007429 [Histomonas meleagridis]
MQTHGNMNNNGLPPNYGEKAPNYQPRIGPQQPIPMNPVPMGQQNPMLMPTIPPGYQQGGPPPQYPGYMGHYSNPQLMNQQIHPQQKQPGHLINQPNVQFTPPQQAQQLPKPPKAPPPKADVIIRSLPIEHHINNCKLSHSFIDRQKSLQRQFISKFNGVALRFTDGAIMQLATALKIRMTYVTKEVVWYSKQRQCQLFPPERQIVDVPRARFSLLEAERIILERNKFPTNLVKNEDIAIHELRNEALEGIASKAPERNRESIISLVEENEEGQTPNLMRLDEMTLHREQSPLVTVDDVNALVENDAMLASSPKLRRCFRYQLYKIMIRQKEMRIQMQENNC